MRSLTRSVFAVILVASLLVCSAPMLCIESSASDSENIDFGTEPTYDLSQSLYFNNSDGPASAEVINTLSGRHVCEYISGFLRFVDSVDLRYVGTDVNTSIFIFNDTGCNQGITVDDGCHVFISCDGDHLLSTIDGRYAAIRSENNNTFVFNGTGYFSIELTSSVHSTYVDGINVNGKISFDDINLNCANDRGAGIVFYGDDIHFNKCNVMVFAESYGVYGKNSGMSTLTFDQCEVSVSAYTRAILIAGTMSYSVLLCSMYGAYNIDRSDEMTIDSIGAQRYIHVVHDLPFFVDSSVFIIIIVAIFALVILVIIFVTLKNRKDRMNATVSSGNDRVSYEPTLPVNHDSDVKEAPRYEFKEAPVYVPREEPVVQRSSSKNEVEITLSSELNDMSSFTFSVDGRVYGYIGYNRSTIDVPSGMHEVVISTNDMNKKVILKENILLNRPMEFFVVKKFKGYAVVRK